MTDRLEIAARIAQGLVAKAENYGSRIELVREALRYADALIEVEAETRVVEANVKPTFTKPRWTVCPECNGKTYIWQAPFASDCNTCNGEGRVPV